MGLSLAAFGVCYGVVQAALMQPVVRRFGERRALLAGLVFGAAGFALYGLAPTGAVFWLGLPVLTLWGLSAPAAQSLMSRRVSPTEQGQLQGAIGSLRGIAGLLGPGLFTSVFAHFIRPGAGTKLPGAPFLLSALLVASSILLAWRVTRGPDPEPAPTPAPEAPG